MFTVIHSRRDIAKYCSRACSDAAPRPHNEVRCKECGIMFRKKVSDARKTVWGNFCGAKCLSAARSRLTIGESNPNWRGRNCDQDGYRYFVGGRSVNGRRIKEHHHVALTNAGLSELPKGMHVHHKDCNILNNRPDNLMILTSSDHKWLHQQLGVAILRAIQHGELDAMYAAGLCDDPSRAAQMLLGDCQTQGAMWAYHQQRKSGIEFPQMTCIKPVMNVEFEVVDSL